MPLQPEVNLHEEHNREPPLDEGTDQELGEESEDDSFVDLPPEEPEAEVEPIELRCENRCAGSSPGLLVCIVPWRQS